MNIKQEIIKTLSKNTKIKVNEETKVSDLGIDSLDLMDLVIEAEEKIGGELSEEVITSLKEKTVGEIIKELEKVAK
ncbi:acyl carrier protein [Mycoplasma todarodis]|uniref:Acyl carrier protein n=1 Tax=Mycoplasma todarodis TaxID=1937191 RepID=A0A4R0XQ05_9MOLU|nr:phosphopantetheine-binding protein [Mycoplasma todarodis]TCG10400.1 acyl carrier protein [Mycoplasma todarodis]